MNIFKIPAEQSLKDQWDLTTARVTEWMQSELFHFKWWVLLVLFCITALLMWKKANKSRIVELTIYSAFIIIFVIVLDELGEELSLWFYTVDILPLFPPISAIDITSMPLIYMLLYQRFGTWGKFLIATSIMSIVFCFVFEPIFVWGGIYTMLTWKSFYGLPIYFGIAAASKGLVNAIYSTKEKRKA